jgi:quercetin dioxygenase-like cupin family protein
MEKGVGPLFKFMDQQMVEESDVTVLVRKVEKEPPQELIIGPSLHRHAVNQLYCLLGDIELEVTLGDEKHLAKAPASILVPAGIDHAIRFVAGKGYLVNVLSGGKYG